MKNRKLYIVQQVHSFIVTLLPPTSLISGLPVPLVESAVTILILVIFVTVLLPFVLNSSAHAATKKLQREA